MRRDSWQWEEKHAEDFAWDYIGEENLPDFLKQTFDGRFSYVRVRRNGDFVDIHINLWDNPE